MKILLAADGSKYTKKALAFLVTHEALSAADTEIVVLHVQAPMPPRVKTMVGAAAVRQYHEEEAQKVLQPIERFLERHDVRLRTRWVIGPASSEIVRASKAEKAHLIVMGTHGLGMLGLALLGSVAQRVVAECDMPVLLVK